MNVELVAKTMPIIEGVDSQGFPAYIARIGKVKDNPEKLLKYLINHKHWSPFEHSYLTFKIETSLAIGRELLRHRSFTFQERSLRYEESIGFEPIEFRKQSEKNRQSSEEIFDPILNPELTPSVLDYDYMGGDLHASKTIEVALGVIEDLYNALIDAGVARECARFILPSCTTTTLLMTGSIRSWIHFLSIRDAPEAQKEMVLIAQEIKSILLTEIPIIFNSIEQ